MPQSIWSRRVQIRKRPRLICSAGRWKPGASQQVDCTHCGALGFVAAASHPLLTPVQTAFGFPHWIQAWCSHVGNEPLAATLKSVVMPVGRSWRPGPTVTHGVWWQQPGLLQPVPQSESIVHRVNSFAVPVPQIFGPATTVCRYFPAIGWVGTMDSHVSVVVVVLVLVLLDVDVDVLDDVDELVLDDVDDVVTGALVDVDVLDVVTGAPVVVVGAAVVVVVDARQGFFAIQGLCAQETAPREGSPLCLAQLSVVNCPHSGSPFSQKQQATLFVG